MKNMGLSWETLTIQMELKGTVLFDMYYNNESLNTNLFKITIIVITCMISFMKHSFLNEYSHCIIHVVVQV